jgi:hypothetical protein
LLAKNGAYARLYNKKSWQVKKRNTYN